MQEIRNSAGRLVARINEQGVIEIIIKGYLTQIIPITNGKYEIVNAKTT